MNRRPFPAKGAEAAKSVHRMTRKMAGAAMRVHTALGPGLLEPAYDACPAGGLGREGPRFPQQERLALSGREVRLECGCRLDLLLEDKAVAEINSPHARVAAHMAQVISCLRLAGRRVGLLISFNAQSVEDSSRRAAHGSSKTSVRSGSSAGNIPC